jgi:hypothetical protein
MSERRNPIHHSAKPLGLSRINLLQHEDIRIDCPNYACKSSVPLSVRGEYRAQAYIPGQHTNLEATIVWTLQEM